MADWRGRRVWLVGASTGIGRALAERLHAQGALVIVSARRMAMLRAFVFAHPGSIALPLDVTDRASVRRAATEAMAGGPLDLVCCCAGHYKAMRATSLDLDLRPHGLGVSVVNPGFVQTALTAQNHFRMPALVSPADAAQAIVQGWAKGEFEIHFPKRFTHWLKLLRLLPYRWYFAAVRRTTGL